MRGYTGGLCIPTFVVDAPGGGGKIPLQPFYLLSASDRDVQLRNYEGMIIKYFNPQETDVTATRKSGGNGRDEDVPRVLNEQAVPSLPKETSRYRRRMKKDLAPLYKGEM
jgi:lysine 2,3-aminomutase